MLLSFLVLWLLSDAKAFETREGNILVLIDNIITYMPKQNSYGFVIPSSEEQNTFAQVTDAILEGQYNYADSLADTLGYRLYEWYDTGQNSDRYYVLMEPDADKLNGVKKGWGTFLFRPENSDNTIIEVPHPLHDYNTWRVGLSAYRYLKVRYYIMAGTHRYANGTDPRPADVAHNTQNMFHTVHQRISPFSQHALQVHGFSRDDYPDVVLSNGSANPSPILQVLADQIVSRGFTVGVYDGINYGAYGATTNTQGQWSRSMGYSFMHMEMERFIRESVTQYNKIITALDSTFYLSTDVKVQAAIEPADNFFLFQNFPNPFNPMTTINVFLPKSGFTKLAIYDQLGCKVKTVVNRRLPAGNQLFTWQGVNDHGNQVSSGIYFYVLEFENQKKVNKMSLIR